MFTQYLFSSTHPTMERYNISRGTIDVHQDCDGKFSASHGEFGCGKRYATPEDAIIGMLTRHSCSVVVHGQVRS